MENTKQTSQEVDETLWAAVDAAIDQAARTAGDELHAFGSITSPHDYYADAVLRHLFLRLCGADPKNNLGGDPEIAWKILYIGRNVARYWERERGGPLAFRRKKERREDIEKDRLERRDLALSAQNFALKTAIGALIDSARKSDPQIVERMEAAIEVRHARLENVSDTDRAFTEMARAYMSHLTDRLE